MRLTGNQPAGLLSRAAATASQASQWAKKLKMELAVNEPVTNFRRLYFFPSWHGVQIEVFANFIEASILCLYWNAMVIRETAAAAAIVLTMIILSMEMDNQGEGRADVRTGRMRFNFTASKAARYKWKL